MGVVRVLATLLLAATLPAFGAPPRHDPDPAHLKAGQFLWHPEVAPQGPVVVVISLDEQRAYVYRNGVAIGLSTISSGRRGHETPPGVFTILQKEREHHSNLYDNAPMPFMERLTWDGVALHSGSLPGYPASHGCVRLPQAFAENLFSITRPGQTVVVANSKVMPSSIVHPAVLAPVGASGETLDTVRPGDRFEWDDAAAPVGPVSIVVAVRDRAVYVLRNGVRIGSSGLDVAADFALGGTLLFVIGEGYEDAPSALDPSRPRHRWSVYPIGDAAASSSVEGLAEQLRLPGEFARRLYPVLAPGTTVVVTDLPAVREPGRADGLQTILESGPRDGTQRLPGTPVPAIPRLASGPIRQSEEPG